MINPLFELNNVTKYRQTSPSSRITVLDNVWARVNKGDLITIIGPSGAGKSTLLSLLNRLEDTDGGEIYYLGKEIKDWNVLELRRQIGLVFQRPVMLPGTVHDNLLFGPKLRADNPASHPSRIIEMIGLNPSLQERDARLLSGGQQQRVALARTLANGCKVLLLDEITASLDHESTLAIEDLITELNYKHGYTCIWVTHDRAQAQRISSQIWLLEDAKIKFI